MAEIIIHITEGCVVCLCIQIRLVNYEMFIAPNKNIIAEYDLEKMWKRLRVSSVCFEKLTTEVSTEELAAFILGGQPTCAEQ